LPPPPRKVITERLPQLPPLPQDIIIERWLGYDRRTRNVVFRPGLFSHFLKKIFLFI
jgi:hypothetical protein